MAVDNAVLDRITLALIAFAFGVCFALGIGFSRALSLHVLRLLRKKHGRRS